MYLSLSKTHPRNSFLAYENMHGNVLLFNTIQYSCYFSQFTPYLIHTVYTFLCFFLSVFYASFTVLLCPFSISSFSFLTSFPELSLLLFSFQLFLCQPSFFSLLSSFSLLCCNFYAICGGWEPSRNRVIVPVRQAT